MVLLMRGKAYLRFLGRLFIYVIPVLIVMLSFGSGYLLGFESGVLRSCEEGHLWGSLFEHRCLNHSLMSYCLRNDSYGGGSGGILSVEYGPGWP